VGSGQGTGECGVAIGDSGGWRQLEKRVGYAAAGWRRREKPGGGGVVRAVLPFAFCTDDLVSTLHMI
jgi:hypothetical protein